MRLVLKALSDCAEVAGNLYVLINGAYEQWEMDSIKGIQCPMKVFFFLKKKEILLTLFGINYTLMSHPSNL